MVKIKESRRLDNGLMQFTCAIQHKSKDEVIFWFDKDENNNFYNIKVMLNPIDYYGSKIVAEQLDGYISFYINLYPLTNMDIEGFKKYNIVVNRLFKYIKVLENFFNNSKEGVLCEIVSS